MHDTVDLRSDTVTRPTPEMRRAMAEAEVGDDVFDDDPSINRLQEMAAERMGKEAGLFVPSGTMGNSIAIKVHTKPGDEALMDTDAHSMLYEVGLPAVIANVMTRQFRSDKGVPRVDEIASFIHKEELDTAGTALIILENTHNRAGGAVIPLDVMRSVQALAREHGIAFHLDGARIFNAQAVTGTAASEFAGCADTVTFCLSKGLGAPVGSVLCGSREFIAKARRVRKMLGGGMRQAGILAAAGIYALDNNVCRLADDHCRARRLADGIAAADGVTLDPGGVPTNMVYFNTAAPARSIVAALKERGVLCNAPAPHRIRMVTHIDIDDDDVDRAVSAVREAAGPAVAV